MSPANQRSTSGAHALTGRKKKLAWLPWLLLALLVLLGLGIWLLVSSLDDDDEGDGAPSVQSSVTTLSSVSDTVSGATVAGGNAATVTTLAASGGATGTPTSALAATPTATNPPTSPAGATPGSGEETLPAAASGPALSADAHDLVAISSDEGALSALVGTPASGQATVQSVVSDEGFWVGTNESNRMFIVLLPEARGTSGESPFQVVAGQTVQITGTVTPASDRIPADLTVDDGRAQLETQNALVEATQLELVA